MTQHRKLFRLPDDPSTASAFCHPDDPSIARGRKDLGQLRASEAGTGFEIAQRSAPQRAAKQTDGVPRVVGSNASSIGASGILRRSGSRMTQGKDASVLCHPDDPSIARGGKDLGQLRGSEAGTGF
jgi:hypothetical protein